MKYFVNKVGVMCVHKRTHVHHCVILGGIVIPARGDGDTSKKPVKYGTRFRGKQKKPEASVVETTSESTEQPDDKLPEGAIGEV